MAFECALDGLSSMSLAIFPHQTFAMIWHSHGQSLISNRHERTTTTQLPSQSGTSQGQCCHCLLGTMFGVVPIHLLHSPRRETAAPGTQAFTLSAASRELAAGRCNQAVLGHSKRLQSRLDHATITFFLSSCRLARQTCFRMGGGTRGSYRAILTAGLTFRLPLRESIYIHTNCKPDLSYALIYAFSAG
ncbi:hypothetical protein K437DRAFT_46720 [Tilletiaria anomala UBC 951]|uniref:Uncharacterized protein n=1 Tax=Tilletiaria anomala (strain ATCC 24038 / CBS 436.72 / UBC 951) TaxID=1037660 RepID=A0A066WE45_TILAU|nr:uncharacterized protein K437DRAFT_46720 [Tilletiaria anomala UBC 951]KDN52036.1 hypothetical protein K437DRAFT_46720 [Tilletiaria anomala UBC 951]